MDIQSIILSEISTILHSEYGLENQDLKLEQTNSNFKGDYTFVVFPLLRYSKKSPEATAEFIGEMLKKQLVEISDFNIVKGFLNLELSNAVWIQSLTDWPDQDTPAVKNIGEGETVVVEYSSPNTNKPLHLGHVRNNVLGYSYCLILAANGYNVIKNNLVNDRGIHICKSMLAWQKFGNSETPASSGIKGDHLVGKYYVAFEKAYREELKTLIDNGQSEDEAKSNSSLMQETREMLQKWEAGDSEVMELWQTMNSWVYQGFDETYAKLGVSFDKIYYESDTYLLGKSAVIAGLDKGVFFKKPDNSVWVDLTDVGLDEKLLMRADGTSVYITQDIGTAQLKYEDFKMDKSVYVVGNEQDYHFKVLQEILRKLNLPYADGIHHLSYGMVDLPEGKMKSREGTVVDADDLINEMISTAVSQTQELGKTEGMDQQELKDLYSILGLGALKYFLLKVDAKKRMLFDPKESIDFQGNTGPFIQYTYTRIASILRNVQSTSLPKVSQLEQEERDLIKLMYSFSDVVNEAANSFNPSVIAQYVFDLSKAYNKFYHQHSILGAQDETTRDFRVHLSLRCGQTIKYGCSLLGIEVPERM